MELELRPIQQETKQITRSTENLPNYLGLVTILEKTLQPQFY